MENHHFSWVNQRFLWPFSIVNCLFTRGYLHNSSQSKITNSATEHPRFLISLDITCAIEDGSGLLELDHLNHTPVHWPGSWCAKESESPKSKSMICLRRSPIFYQFFQVKIPPKKWQSSTTFHHLWVWLIMVNYGQIIQIWLAMVSP